MNNPDQILIKTFGYGVSSSTIKKFQLFKIFNKIINLSCNVHNINVLFDLNNIKKTSKYDKYLITYPDTQDDNFEEIINKKLEFNYHKQPDIFFKKFDDYCKPNKKLILQPHQRFLKNFISQKLLIMVHLFFMVQVQVKLVLQFQLQKVL